MRWWLAALGLIACGGKAAPEPLPPGPATRNLPSNNSTHVGAMKMTWDSLAITGANWEAQLATIPEAERAALAEELLEDGKFECPAMPQRAGECPEDRALQSPTETSTLDDPCLRRLIALWALQQLHDEDTLTSIADELLSLAGLPPPERELPAAAIARMPSGFLTAAALWEAKTAGNNELVSPHALEGMAREDLLQAAASFHFDEALLALDPSIDTDLYLDALLDDALRPTTRLEVIDLMTSEVIRTAGAELEYRIRGRLDRLVETDDCTIAAAAQAAIAKLDGKGVAMVAGPFMVEQDVIRAICASLGVGARGKAWKSVVARRGLDVVSHTEDPFRVDALWTKYPFAYDNDEDGVPDVPEADPDLDGDAATWKEVDRVYWTKKFTLPFSDELKLALPHCEELRCRVPGTSVWFQLDIRLQRGAMYRLVGIDRHEKLWSDC